MTRERLVGCSAAARGIAGVFLAVPLLACMRILAQHVKAFEPVGVFLGEEGVAT